MPRPVSNPPNPWESTAVEWLEPPPPARLEVFEERAKSILTTNASPDVPFRWSVNAYRGCQHACAYCFARVHHQYLGFGAGTDFDRKIVVKTNAAELLHYELSKRSWTGEPFLMSGVTDPYQPLEASYRLTRRCLEVCRRLNNPVVLLTKAALIARDVDVLEDLHHGPGVHVCISVPFANARTARKIEPGASSPTRRFEAMRVLADRGIPVGVGLAPLIPALNESEVPEILRRAADAGASWAFHALVHLTAEALDVFRERLAEAFPDRASHVMSALGDVRGGRIDEKRFHRRMRGSGPRWDTVVRLFEVHCRRLGLGFGEEPEETRLCSSRPCFRQESLFP